MLPVMRRPAAEPLIDRSIRLARRTIMSREFGLSISKRLDNMVA